MLTSQLVMERHCETNTEGSHCACIRRHGVLAHGDISSKYSNPDI